MEASDDMQELELQMPAELGPSRYRSSLGLCIRDFSTFWRLIRYFTRSSYWLDSSWYGWLRFLIVNPWGKAARPTLTISELVLTPTKRRHHSILDDILLQLPPRSALWHLSSYILEHCLIHHVFILVLLVCLLAITAPIDQTARIAEVRSAAASEYSRKMCQ